jgi:dienelactone hydrolase
MERRRWIRRFITAAAVLLLAVGLGLVVWASFPHQAAPAAEAALVSDQEVRVEKNEPWLTFYPAGERPAAGLVFYPGGRVVPEAYAPLARRIAAEGYLVVIPEMPLNLAVFRPGAAEDVLAAYPTVDAWAVGGHSLGGAMAAQFAAANPGRVAGLVLWASYPPESSDLSGSGLDAVSIYGTRDGLASPGEVLGARDRLPLETKFVAVEGGNHAGFGAYGTQRGDNPADIRREEQAAQVTAATVELLDRIRE